MSKDIQEVKVLVSRYLGRAFQMEETTTAKNVKSGETSASKENHKRNKQGRE